MQKKLIVLAIASLAATSAYAADTTVYGVVDAAVVNVGGSGLTSTTQVQASGLATSRLGVKASEDLDGGLKAIGVLEYAVTLNNSGQTTVYGGSSATSTTTSTSTAVGNNLSARQQMVGLAGGFGTVAAGYLQTAGLISVLSTT